MFSRRANSSVDFRYRERPERFGEMSWVLRRPHHHARASAPTLRAGNPLWQHATSQTTAFKGVDTPFLDLIPQPHRPRNSRRRTRNPLHQLGRATCRRSVGDLMAIPALLLRGAKGPQHHRRLLGFRARRRLTRRGDFPLARAVLVNAPLLLQCFRSTDHRNLRQSPQVSDSTTFCRRANHQDVSRQPRSYPSHQADVSVPDRN